MNKIEALNAAQDLQCMEETNGYKCDIDSLSDNGRGMPCYYVSSTSGKNETFAYEEQKQPARDTLCLCSDNVLRYSEGRIDTNGRNSFFPAGYSSKNSPPICNICWFKEFEIIETPTDFERMQTPDEMCDYFDCKNYVHKYQRVESEKWSGGSCGRCKISVSKPTGLKNE